MVTFKDFLQEDAKTDIQITQAAQSMIHGMANYLKREMTDSVFKSLQKDTYFFTSGDKAKFELDQDDEREEVYFRVHVSIDSFMKEWPGQTKTLAVEFIPRLDTHWYGSFTPYERRNKINIFIEPKFLLNDKKNFKQFHKLLTNGQVYSTLTHEFGHYVDALRFFKVGKKLPDYKQPQDDYNEYYNSVPEINARYFEAVLAMLEFIKRLYRVQTSIKEFHPTAKGFVDDFMVHIPQYEQLNEKNRKKMIRRAYKLYDDIAAMKPEKFVQFKKTGIPRRWIESHIRKVQNL